MDEYSQEKAENTEVATGFIKSIVMMLPVSAIMFAGAKSSSVRQKLQSWGESLGNKFPKYKNIITEQFPTILSLGIGLAVSAPLSIWATKKQTEASAKGRMEAMTTDLANPASFAVLTDQQMAQVDAIAQNITLEDENKGPSLLSGGILGGGILGGGNKTETITTVKNLFGDDAKYKAQKEAFNLQMQQDEIAKEQNTPITKEQAEKAKRDQQILSTMIRKIDTASQDYAENVEFTTNTVTAITTVAGGLLIKPFNKLLEKTKLLEKFNVKQGSTTSQLIGLALPLIGALGANLVASHLQKEASKVGKFKAKQEIMQNPENFVYVDDETLAREQECDEKSKKKEKNLFSFLIQAFKDKKEYDNYQKTEGVMNKKRQKAIEQIQLSNTQMQDAKALQKNIFKSFNKVDEKSQKYSESVECIGENVQEVVNVVSTLGMMFGMAGSMQSKNPLKGIGATLAFGTLPQVIIDYFITKEQKKASRVADMQALKELDDYRNYVDYSQSPNNRLCISA